MAVDHAPSLFCELRDSDEVGLYLDGRFPFDRLVKLYDFDAINQDMDDSKTGRTVKPVLRIP